MANLILVGLGAGVTSALLVSTAATGSPLAIVLFYLAPLPIMIAALGFSHLAGLVGALVAGAALLVAVGGGLLFLAYIVGIGAPAWFLAYLALLARTGEDGQTEWYPTGRLLFAIAIVSAGMLVVPLAAYGFSPEAFREGLAEMLGEWFRLQSGEAIPERIQEIPRETFVQVFTYAMPPMAAVFSALTLTLNLWLAGRIVRLSGRLPRPWPDIAASALPGFAPLVLLAVIIGAAVLPGFAGFVCGVLAATLVLVYGLAGLCVVHMLSRGMGARGFMLASLYLAIPLFGGWPFLVFVLVGLVDQLMDLRRRAAIPPSGPPGPPPTV